MLQPTLVAMEIVSSGRDIDNENMCGIAVQLEKAIKITMYRLGVIGDA
jgi:hypothetical protein